MSDETGATGSSTAPVESRIAQLCKASTAAQTAEPARAYELAEQALQLANELGDPQWLAEALYCMGGANSAEARYRDALSYYERARVLYEEHENHVQVVNCWGSIGLSYTRLSDYRASLESYMQALELAEATNNARAVARLQSSIGSVYLHLGDFARGLEHCMQSLVLRERIGDTHIGPVLNNIANTYMQLGDTDKALSYYRRSLQYCVDTANEFGRGLTLINLSEVQMQRGDDRAALESLSESLSIFIAFSNLEMQAQVLLAIGYVYERQGEYPLALEYQKEAAEIAYRIEQRHTHAQTLLRMGCVYRLMQRHSESVAALIEAVRLADDIAVASLQIKVHEELARTYEELGDPEAALEHLRKVMRLGEKELAKEQQGMAEEITMHFEVEKARREKELYQLRNVELVGALREVEQLNVHLRELGNEKTELLGVMTHELRNPLAGILASVTLIKEYGDKMSQEEIVRQLRRIEETANRSSDTLEHLLEISTIESGKLTLSFQPVDLCAVVRKIASLYEERAALKQIVLECKCEPGIVVVADEKALFDIIDNVVSNAVKYSPLHKRVWIAVERTAEHARVLVGDEGPGLTADDRKKLFGKFQRLSARPTGGEASTGLGLYIARQIAELHGGTIYAESQIGQGCVFTVVLPVQNE